MCAYQNGDARSNGGASLPALRAAFERASAVLAGSRYSEKENAMRPIIFPRPVFRKPAPSRWACVSDPVTCRRCHHEWPDGDPAYQMVCRGCGAPPGRPCCRPEGGNERVCFQRDQDARRAGLLISCEGLSWDGRHDKPMKLSLSRSLGACAVLSGAPPARRIAA